MRALIRRSVGPVVGFGVLTLASFAQPGFPDPTFDAGSLRPSEESSPVITGLVQSGGAVVLVRSGIPSAPQRRLIRIFADGRSDDRFGQDPLLVYAGNPTLVVEPTPGTLLFSGNVKPLGKLTQPFSLTAQGWVNSSYHPASDLRIRPISAMVATAEGGLWIGHRFAPSPSPVLGEPLVERLDPDGGRVGSFRSALRGVGTVTALRIVGDGRLLVSGRLRPNGSSGPRSLVRLNPDGSLDSSYVEPPSIRGRSVSGLSAASDGGIAAWVGDALDSPPDRLVRLHPDGSESSGPDDWDGRAGFTPIQAVLADGDGFLVAGSGLVRLDATGRIDSAARLPSVAGPTNRVNLLLRLPDRSVVVGGAFSRIQSPDGQPLRRPGCFRMMTSGDVDLNFGRTGFSSAVASLAPRLDFLLPLQDGRLLAAGFWSRFNGAPAGSICRLLPDGARDPSFPLDALRSPKGVMAAELGDGSVLVGLSQPSSLLNLPPVHLLRLDSAGQITAVAEPEGPVLALARSPDGSVLVAAQFAGGDPAVDGPILRRMRPDGSWDPAWFVDLDFQAGQPPGQLLIRILTRGRFVVGVPGTGRIRRYLPDGSPDDTFEANPGVSPRSNPPTLTDLAVDDDGSVLAIGPGLQSTDGSPVPALRWTPAGLQDRSFALGVTGQLTGVAPAGLGRFLVAGNFLRLGRTSLPGLVRILPNGVLDPSYRIDPDLVSITGLGASGDGCHGLGTYGVRRTTGGTGESYYRLVRLDNRARSLLDPEPTPLGLRLRLVGPSGEGHVVETSSDLMEWSPVAALVIPTNSISEWILPRQLSGDRQFFRDRRLE